MMSISNENIDFKQTDANYHLVQAMGDKIKSMSFGLDLLDESTMFCEMSVMMREQGSLAPAYKWAQKALQVSQLQWPCVSVGSMKCVAEWLRHWTRDQGVWSSIPEALMCKSVGQIFNPHRLCLPSRHGYQVE